MRRLLPPSLVLLLIGLMVLVTLVLPIGMLPWVPFRLAGMVPLAAGMGLTVSGSSLFGRTGTNIKTFDDPDVLVTDGPFRWSRNPMYLGFVLFLVGVALMTGGASAWVGPVAFFITADRWYIPFEEARMRKTFGESYDRYRADVPRWLPYRLRVGRSQTVVKS